MRGGSCVQEMARPRNPTPTLLLLRLRPERPAPDRSDVRVKKTADRDEKYNYCCSPRGKDNRRIRAASSHYDPP
jgi:hypothetical protein